MERKNGDRKTRRARARTRGFVNPPMLKSNVVISHKFRFLSSAALVPTTTGYVTVGGLLGAAGTLGRVANTSVTCIFGSVRLKRIEMWAPPAAQGGAATVSVNYFAAAGQPNMEFSDTSVSVAQPAHIVAYPPSQSLAGFWQNAIGFATALCGMTGPAGTIVDVDVDLVMGDQDGTGQLIINVATSVLGQIYYLALDQPGGTHVAVPVSLSTTF